VTPASLRIADNASLILPLHAAMDHAARPRAATARSAPPARHRAAYEDKVARRGIRVCDLAEPQTLADKLDELLLHHNTLLRGLGADTFEKQELLNWLLALAPRILPFAEPVWSDWTRRDAPARASCSKARRR